MVDSVSLISTEGVVLKEAMAPIAQPMQQLDPAETRAFSVLMRDLDGSGAVNQHKAAAQQPNELQRSIIDKGVELSQSLKSVYQDTQFLMTEEAGFGSDPILFMKNVTEFHYRSSQSLMQINLTSSLASAATSSFHTLFKNQG